MIDMQTMVRPLKYSAKDTLRIIKGNCTPSLRTFLKAYKVSDLDSLMILADEYKELEKEREAFAQENKFSKTKSASPTQVTCRRYEETGTQETRGNDQRSSPNRVPRQQATEAPRGGQWTPPQGHQVQHKGLVKRHISQTLRRPTESAAVMDTGRGDVGTNACCSAGCVGE